MLIGNRLGFTFFILDEPAGFGAFSPVGAPLVQVMGGLGARLICADRPVTARWWGSSSGFSTFNVSGSSSPPFWREVPSWPPAASIGVQLFNLRILALRYNEVNCRSRSAIGSLCRDVDCFQECFVIYISDY